MANKRDRSPSYPNIPLGVALERLVMFEKYFKHRPARPEKVGEAWGIKAKAYADRTAAALRYYGLIDYENEDNSRQIVISEDGLTYLRAQQDHIKQEVVRKAALRPAQISKFWMLWGDDRPDKDVCIDELILKNNFSEEGARKFLNVYDATITYAELSNSDKITSKNEDVGDQINDDDNTVEDFNSPPLHSDEQKQRISLMMGERELTTGLLSKDASFRLIVNGEIGVKEIGRLIKKLKFDKDILADAESEYEEPAN